MSHCNLLNFIDKFKVIVSFVFNKNHKMSCGLIYATDVSIYPPFCINHVVANNTTSHDSEDTDKNDEDT